MSDNSLTNNSKLKTQKSLTELDDSLFVEIELMAEEKVSGGGVGTSPLKTNFVNPEISLSKLALGFLF